MAPMFVEHRQLKCERRLVELEALNQLCSKNHRTVGCFDVSFYPNSYVCLLPLHLLWSSSSISDIQPKRPPHSHYSIPHPGVSASIAQSNQAPFSSYHNQIIVSSSAAFIV